MSTTTRKPVRKMTHGQRVLASLQEIIRALETGDNSRLTIRHVEIEGPRSYGPKEVKSLREKLGVSQGVFAELLAVSRVLVEHWEYGRRSPAPVVCRLMDQIAADPQGYLSALMTARKAS